MTLDAFQALTSFSAENWVALSGIRESQVRSSSISQAIPTQSVE